MDFGAYPAVNGRDPWSNTSSERGPGNQSSITGKYHLPLQSNSQNPLSGLLQDTPPYSGPGVSSNGCFDGVSDSCSALSLLSTQTWGSRTRSASLGASNFLGTDGAPVVQPSGVTIGQFAYNQADDALHEIPPDLGLRQASHAANNQFIGELGLTQPNEGHFHELGRSRDYDASLQHMHWSL